MKPMHVVLGLLILGGVAAVVFWWNGSASPGSDHRGVATGAGAGAAGTLGTAEDSKAAETTRQKRMRGELDAPGSPPDQQPVGGGVHTAGYSGVVGPVPATLRARSAGGRTTTSGSSGTPKVSARLAFKALLYVGVDPEAEKTWMQAINDPNLPEGVRSDLIEDLNDEGYEDPGGNHITKRDLPLILARLEIIERLAPYAMDKVNADAFEEAYKDLLNMYVHLVGGK